MSNINTVTVSGFLASDPEVRFTNDEGEIEIVRLGVVVKRQFKKQGDSEYTEESSIFDVEVFGKFASLVARKLRKFSVVTVNGSLKKDEFEVDGQKRSAVKIRAAQIDSQDLFLKDDEVKALQDGSVGGDGTDADAPAGADDALPGTADATVPF